MHIFDIAVHHRDARWPAHHVGAESRTAHCSICLGLAEAGAKCYLYQFVVEVNCTSESAFGSFAVDHSTGLLNYLGDTSSNVFSLGPPLTVATDNLYAYAAGGNGSYTGISGFQKQSNGNLVDLNQTYPFPSGQPANYGGAYIEQAAADTTNHLAMNIYYVTDNNTNTDKIATYAIHTTTGNLTTNSTYANMPSTLVGESTAQAMAPSGKLLAVSGPNGVQIFNFNSGGQATATPTGLITHTPTDQIYWDNSNHVYAISNADGTIQVFTVTATSATQVSGSPYFVTHRFRCSFNRSKCSCSRCIEVSHALNR